MTIIKIIIQYLYSAMKSEDTEVLDGARLTRTSSATAEKQRVS